MFKCIQMYFFMKKYKSFLITIEFWKIYLIQYNQSKPIIGIIFRQLRFKDVLKTYPPPTLHENLWHIYRLCFKYKCMIHAGTTISKNLESNVLVWISELHLEFISDCCCITTLTASHLKFWFKTPILTELSEWTFVFIKP